MDWDWAKFIAILSPVVTAALVYMSQRARRDDHERSRRQEAVRLMQYWLTEVTRDWEKCSATISFLGTLDSDACERVESGKEFHASRSAVPHIAKLLPARDTLPADAITSTEAWILRLHVVKFLNLMEIIAAAYKDNVADRDMIFREFRYIIYTNEACVAAEYVKKTARYESLAYLMRDFDARINAVAAKGKTG